MNLNHGIMPSRYVVLGDDASDAAAIASVDAAEAAAAAARAGSRDAAISSLTASSGAGVAARAKAAYEAALAAKKTQVEAGILAKAAAMEAKAQHDVEMEAARKRILQAAQAEEAKARAYYADMRQAAYDSASVPTKPKSNGLLLAALAAVGVYFAVKG